MFFYFNQNQQQTTPTRLLPNLNSFSFETGPVGAPSKRTCQPTLILVVSCNFSFNDATVDPESIIPRKASSPAAENFVP